MTNTSRFTTAAVAVAAAFFLGSTVFAGSYDPDQELETPGAAAIYDRVITITPGTAAINVSQGERVKFVATATGKSFVWNFDTSDPVFDLEEVAPSGALGGQHVMAYVQLNNNDDH